MTLDPRHRDLLGRYPLDLTRDELLELRTAAEASPAIDRLMDSLLTLDALLEGEEAPSTDPILTDAGRDRLEAVVGHSLKAFGAPAHATDPAGATTSETIPSLSEARRRRLLSSLTALAAAALLGAALLLGGGSETSFRARGDIQELEGVLWVMGETRLTDGATRSAQQPVTFGAVLQGGAASLVLLETQAGATHVLHPAPGAAWEGAPGSNPLRTDDGEASYRPARAGTAEYHLVAAAPAPTIPHGPVESAEAFAAGCGGRVVDRLTIVWEAEVGP